MIPGCAIVGAAVTLEEFKESATGNDPPRGLSPELVALWHDFKGDWHAAHDTAQDIHTATGCRIHAYLHRKEGDLGNARYWYRRASCPEHTGGLTQEWAEIAESLLG